MNWAYERWMNGQSPYWHGLPPVVNWNVKGPYPWECTAMVKEGPKAMVEEHYEPTIRIDSSW